MAFLENSGSTPDNTGKIQGNGRFVKGQSGNPAGRPKGALNKTTRIARAILEREVEDITESAINLATHGNDSRVLKFLLDHLMPLPKDAPVSFSLPPLTTIADVAQAQIAVLQAVAEGSLTPSEGQTIIAMTDRLFTTLKKQSPESSACDG
jgi:hypothetical protein